MVSTGRLEPGLIAVHMPGGSLGVDVTSDLDVVLAGHADGINMIEVGAAEVPETDVLGAIEFGYDHIKQRNIASWKCNN